MRKQLLLALALFFTCTAYAGQIPTAKITNVLVKESEKSVNISFSVFVPKVGTNYKFILTPVLYSAQGSKPLTAIAFTGRNKSIMEKRKKPSTIKYINGKEKQNTLYRVVVPYEDWMAEVSLKVNSSVEACGRSTSISSVNVLKNKLISYDIKPQFNTAVVEPQLTALQQFDQTASFLYPASQYEDRYEIFEKKREKGSLVIAFQQGFSFIDASYKNNKQTLAQVNKVLDLIASDSSASLKKIVIVGLASPEGSLAKNDILAEKRANALKYFVGERVKYDPNLFEIINGTEDWTGLKKLVEDSRMPGRWQVLEIMENYSVRGGRELELMKLNAGNPYRYMLEHFFPKLRNAGYVQIYYESTPDVETQIINKAIELVNEKQYGEALPILLSITSDKQLENTIGVCYMMTSDYAQAKIYFEKAISNGNSDAADAASNLEQIRIIESIN